MNARGFIQYSPFHTVNEAEPPLFPDIMENDDRIKFYARKTHFSRKNRQTLKVFSKEDGINSKRKKTPKSPKIDGLSNKVMASQNRDSMRLKQYNGLPINRYRNDLEGNVLGPIISTQNDRFNINLVTKNVQNV